MKVQRLDLPGGATLWLGRVEEVEPGEWPALYAQMDPARQARCNRYRRGADKRRCVLADALARHALSQATGFPPKTLRFAQAPGGKPSAVGVERHFSLSHSGSLVLCAEGPTPLGADVQRWRRVSDSLLRRAARAGCAGDTEAAFFAWWTRQEAAGKLTGDGLRLGRLPAGLTFWEKILDEPDGTYSLCVCTREGS